MAVKGVLLVIVMMQFAKNEGMELADILKDGLSALKSNIVEMEKKLVEKIETDQKNAQRGTPTVFDKFVDFVIANAKKLDKLVAEVQNLKARIETQGQLLTAKEKSSRKSLRRDKLRSKINIESELMDNGSVARLAGNGYMKPKKV